MANEYQKVVSLLGENLAALLELAKKWLIVWNMDARKIIHTLSHLKKKELAGLMDGSFEIVEVEKEKVELPPLPQDIATKELKGEPYIYDFFGKADVETIKATDIALTMPKPEKLGKVTTERELLQRHSELASLEDDELLEKAVTIFPEKDVLFGAMVNAIIESEEGRSKTIPTEPGTWTISFCVDSDGLLCVLDCDRRSDGWDVHCELVVLGFQWDADDLLFLATES